MRQLIAELPTVADDNLVVRILDLSTDQATKCCSILQPPARMALASTHLLHLADHHYQLDIRPSVVSCRQPFLGGAGGRSAGRFAEPAAGALLYSLFSQRQRALTWWPGVPELRISEQSLRKPTTSCAVC
jgi:hypothetical protein